MFVDVKYARAADGTHVAYAVFGTGPIDLVYSFGYLSNIDASAQWADQAALWQELSSFSRLIVFDRRGSGLSDRTSQQETSNLEAGMDDIRAVMDAAGSDRALLVGVQDGGMLCALFAASYPERTSGLVTFGSGPRGLWATDYPWGWTEPQWDAWFNVVETSWGTVEHARTQMDMVAPDRVLDTDEAQAQAMLLRGLASPGDAVAVDRMLRDTDVRGVLPAVRVPTLVLHTAGNQMEPVEVGRYVASLIPEARFIELPGREAIPLSESREPFVEAIRQFAASFVDEEAELNRVLATVLFTDIVGSTKTAADLGDRAWAELVAEHHATVRGMLVRYRGKEVDTAGDGFFATFDGPVRAVRCAQRIQSALEPLGLSVRAGIHTGEVQRTDEKIAGMAVVIGARIAAMASASEIYVSQTVKDLTAGSGLTFEGKGEHQLKGVPDRWQVYLVTG